MQEIGCDDSKATVVADGFLRVSEAAAFLGLSRSALYALMEQGKLAYAKIGNARRIPRRALIEFGVSSLKGGEVTSS